jgi:hypothetical protein
MKEKIMKRMFLLAMGLACLGIGVDAAADEREHIQQIADEAGVSIDDVRMVLGSRTQFAQYRTRYDRVEPLVLAAAARMMAKRNSSDGRAIATAQPQTAAAPAVAMK